MDDWSFILGWGAWNAVTLGGGRHASWIWHEPRSAAWHDALAAAGPSALTIRVVYALSFVPWVLAVWLFARTYSDVDSPLYWVALSLLTVGQLCEKFWHLAHWEWRTLLTARCAALAGAACYAGATVCMGLCSVGVGGWQFVPGVVMGGLAVCWLVWLAAIGSGMR